jgi:glucose dehydrogenase
MGTGNPAPDVDGRVRPGDNLYTDCLVALDLETGKLRWYFQEVSHDLWDYDPASPVVLLDVKDSSGATVPAVAQAGKTAWVYVIDRRTGKPIRRSDAFAPQEKMFTAPDEKGLLLAPSTLGGSDWSPTAFSPRTGYLYVDGNYFPQFYRRNHEELTPPAQYWGGVVVAPPKGQFGTYSAVDVNTGKIAWQVHLAKPTISGSVATAGGVVFTGLSDSLFVAFDAKTGAELWHYRAAAGVNAPGITYAVRGRQYVAVAAGGNLPLNTARGDALLVFALPTAPRGP